MITGNVQIDRTHLERAGKPVPDAHRLYLEHQATTVTRLPDRGVPIDPDAGTNTFKWQEGAA